MTQNFLSVRQPETADEIELARPRGENEPLEAFVARAKRSSAAGFGYPAGNYERSMLSDSGDPIYNWQPSRQPPLEAADGEGMQGFFSEPGTLDATSVLTWDQAMLVKSRFGPNLTDGKEWKAPLNVKGVAG